MEQICECGHLESFHDTPPGAVCVADPCRCAAFAACSHPEREVQHRLDGALDLVCATCGQRETGVSA